MLLLQYLVLQYIFVDMNVEMPEVAATFLSVKHRVYS